MLTFIMSIKGARVEYYRLLCIHINLDVTVPQVAMAQSRLDSSSTGLQRPQGPSNNLVYKCFCQISQFSIFSVDILQKRDVGTKLTRKVLFPIISPIIDPF